MKGFAYAYALAAIGAVSATPAVNDPPTKRATLEPVTVSGNAFYTGDKRFYIRGIDYQPGGSSASIDPLADKTICMRDLENFKDLGINTVRVYTVDNSKSHDDCMNAFAGEGIYVVLDLNTPKYSINRADPARSYNTDYLQSIFATAEQFAQYDNTLALFSGNEVINDEANTDKAAPYVKAVTRDVRNYMRARNLRAVPVGYSAADVSSNRIQTAHYMNCGSDDARSDFFAFNDYSWCNSDFKTSGWDQKVKNFTEYGIAIFLSEWGCIVNRPREFDELSALMSSDMDGVYSGGLMYEYTNETNGYGIVSVSGNKVTKLDEYDMFKSALAKNPTPTGNGGAASTTHAVPCPPTDASWSVDSEEIPVMPAQAQKFFKSGAGTGPGLNGAGSQDAADSGTSTAGTTAGTPSPTGSNKKESSASQSFDKSPLIITGLTLLMTLGGTMLL